MDDSERFEDVQTIVTCPLDKAHSVTKNRLARHLVKCIAQNPEIVKTPRMCPFNFKHVIPLKKFAVNAHRWETLSMT